MATPGQVQVKASFFGTDDVLKQMNVIGRAGEQFGSAMTSKLGKMFGAVAIGTMAFSKLEQSISRNVATAKQVSGMAIKFNVDPKTVHSMKIAADDAGVSVRALMMSTKQLAKVAGEGMQNRGMLENWKQLGIEADKLAIIQAKPMEFLPELAQRLAAIGDENERAAAGAMLFGRQYQQLAPLLDELGASEEARNKFMDNQNAMTAEQIAQNKEIARLQSEMEESFNKMAAAFTPLLNIAMNFATYLANSLTSLMTMIAKAEEWDKAHNKEKSGSAQLKTDDFATGLQLRQINRREKQAKGEELTQEDKDEMAAVEAAGGEEEYVIQQLENLRAKKKMEKNAESRFMDKIPGVTGAKRFAAGGLEYLGLSEGTAKSIVNGAQDFAIPGTTLRAGLEAKDKLRYGAVYAKGGQLQVDDAFEKRVGAGAAEISDADMESAKAKLRAAKAARGGAKLERDEEGNLFYTDPKTGARMNAKTGLAQQGKERLEEGQDAKAKLDAEAAGPAIAAQQALSRMKGKYYDQKTGKEYSKEEYDKLLASRRMGADGIGPLNFEDKKKKRAEERKAKTIKDAYEKSERHMAKPDMSPVEKAEEAVDDIRKDQAVIQEDINEKLQDELDLKTSIAKAEAFSKSFAEKQVAAQAEINELQKDGTKLTDFQLELVKKKHGVGKDEVKVAEGIAGSIAGANKQLTALEQERIQLQTKLNGEKSKEIQAIEAVKKAKEQEWLKEKKAAEDIANDKKDYEKEMRDIKYKNAKLNGASEQQIKEEKFKDEMKDYKEAAKEQEDLDKEIAAKQQARIDEAYATGGDTGKAGQMTDEEKELSKKAREKKDAKRKGATSALFALADEKGSAAVVSDLGKMGGGRAVQFGNNNPAELIRKSNYWLEIIAKEVGSEKIAEAEKQATATIAVFSGARPGTTP